MRNVTIAILFSFSILLFGCAKEKTVTPPLDNIVIKEVNVPVATCPNQMDKVVIPLRPRLAVNDLTPADNKNYDKVGKAYMKSIADLNEYSELLEGLVQGVQDICRSVNTPLSEQPK